MDLSRLQLHSELGSCQQLRFAAYCRHIQEMGIMTDALLARVETGYGALSTPGSDPTFAAFAPNMRSTSK